MYTVQEKNYRFIFSSLFHVKNKAAKKKRKDTLINIK